jgi:hypothetical protein
MVRTMQMPDVRVGDAEIPQVGTEEASQLDRQHSGKGSQRCLRQEQTEEHAENEGDSAE